MKNYWNTLWTIAQREILVQIQSVTFWITWIVVSVTVGLFVLLVWVLVHSVQVLSTATNFVDVQEEVKSMFSSVQELQTNSDSSLTYYVVDHSDGFSDRIRLAIWDDKDISNWNLSSLGDFDIKAHFFDPQDEETKLSYAAQPFLQFKELQEPNVPISTLSTWLDIGKIDGYFVLPKNTHETPDDATFVTRLTGFTLRDQRLLELKTWFEEMTKIAIQSEGLESLGINEQDRDRVSRSIEVDIVKVLPKSSSSSLAVPHTHSQDTLLTFIDFDLVASIGFMLLFGFVLLIAGQLFLTNVVEEKSNRLGEFLSSTVDPAQLLDGKLLGQILVVGIGLALVCVVVFPLLVVFLESLPPSEANSLMEVLSPFKMLHWLLFLVCALCFFGYIVTALGSLCQDAKEVSMTLYPVSFVVVFGAIPVSLMALFAPDSTITNILTFIPPVTPFAMIGRSAAVPEWPIYLLLVVLSLSSIVIVRPVSTRIFSKGLLIDHAVTDFRKMILLTRKSDF